MPIIRADFQLDTCTIYANGNANVHRNRRRNNSTNETQLPTRNSNYFPLIYKIHSIFATNQIKCISLTPADRKIYIQKYVCLCLSDCWSNSSQFKGDGPVDEEGKGELSKNLSECIQAINGLISGFLFNGRPNFSLRTDTDRQGKKKFELNGRSRRAAGWLESLQGFSTLTILNTRVNMRIIHEMRIIIIHCS